MVGETVGSKSVRKGEKVASLDMKLPRIGDNISHEREAHRRGQNSIDNIRLPRLQKQSKNYRYRYGNKSNKGIYESYIGKGSLKSTRSNKAMSVNKLKMYQNNIKMSHRDYEKQRKPYHDKLSSKFGLNFDELMSRSKPIFNYR